MRRSRFLPPLAALSMLTLAAATAPTAGAAPLADDPGRATDTAPTTDTAQRPEPAVVAARYALPDDVSFPEGIAALPDGTFVVGSTTDGSLTRLWPDGTTEPFAPGGEAGRTTAVGLAVDGEGRVYAAGGATGVLSVLDADGTALRTLRAPGEPSEGFLNDVAVSDDGWGYVTDSRRPVIYRFNVDEATPRSGERAGDGRLEAWLDLTDTPLTYEDGFNLNGIVVSESGSFLVAVQSNTGALWRITTDDGTVERIDTDGVSFEGGDGLALVNPAPSEPHDARPTLYVVQNAASTITRLDLDPAGRWAEVTGTVRSDELRFPTTAALDGDRLLVVNGQLDQRDGDPITPFDVTATPLTAFDRDATSTCDAANAANAGITLPDGLCASVFADGLVGARHLSVAPDGTVYVAIADAPGGDPDGGVVALRDDDGDGHAEHIERFGERGGNGVTVHDGWLYLARNDSVVRYRLPAGDSVGLTPDGDPETIVSGLPDSPDHFAKTAVIDDEGRMFVNIGSPSNACQVDNREPFSPGIDPCPELEDRAGIWRFDADEQGQTQADGTRYATGVRNANALATDPDTGRLYAAINGRDQLFENWPDRYDEADDLTKPAEEVHAIVEGGDYGWPYCYFDPQQGRHVLAPEYGGDGREVGRCDDVPEPAVTFPAHWAPLGMTFPTVDALGERYRDGAFIAFHGSRFDPANQPEGPGYVVAFVPFEDGMATGEWEVFANGFAGDSTDLPAEAEHRAVDVAEGPDGALYLSDDVGGRIWRISPESR